MFERDAQDGEFEIEIVAEFHLHRLERAGKLEAADVIVDPVFMAQIVWLQVRKAGADDGGA